MAQEYKSVYQPDKIISEIQKILTEDHMKSVSILFKAELDEVPTLEYTIEKYVY